LNDKINHRKHNIYKYKRHYVVDVIKIAVTHITTPKKNFNLKENNKSL